MAFPYPYPSPPTTTGRRPFYSVISDVTEKKVSVQDIIAFQRSSFEGTDRSLADLPQWFVSDGQGGKLKSPLATPFINADLAALLGIENERPIARYKCGHGWVAQVRDFVTCSDLQWRDRVACILGHVQQGRLLERLCMVGFRHRGSPGEC